MCLIFKVQQCLSLHAKGPPVVILDVDSYKNQNGILNGIGQLGLWCQAVDSQTRRPVPIKSASFRHLNQRFEATLSEDKYNASFVREKSPAVESGVWKCHLHTAYGNASGEIQVNVRPVILTNASLRVDEKDGSRIRYDVTGLTIIRGEKAELKCPVYGNPKPDIVWRLADTKQILTSGDTYTIPSVDDKSDATYVCTATNSLIVNGARQRFDLVIERRLRVKSEFAWMLPLFIILVIIILLIITIVFCECRKRRNEQKLIVQEEE